MKNRDVKTEVNARARRSAAAGERGFSLIETLIALVLMMIVGLGVVSLFAYTISNNSSTGDRATALAIAQQYMERLRSAPFDEVTAEAGTPIDPVVSAGRPYKVVTTVCTASTCGGSATLKRITVEVTPLTSSSKWAISPISVTALRASLTPGSNIQ